MKTFYDEWLNARSEIQDQLRASGFVARDKDIPWVRTPQDVKCKLMIGNDLGFATMGSNVLKAEIPVGWFLMRISALVPRCHPSKEATMPRAPARRTASAPP